MDTGYHRFTYKTGDGIREIDVSSEELAPYDFVIHHLIPAEHMPVSDITYVGQVGVRARQAKTPAISECFALAHNFVAIHI